MNGIICFITLAGREDNVSSSGQWLPLLMNVSGIRGTVKSQPASTYLEEARKEVPEKKIRIKYDNEKEGDKEKRIVI